MADPIISKLLEAVRQITADHKTLLDTEFDVKTLTPFEAIGSPGNWDYPLLRGKEILLQATFRGSLGQAFTGTPAPFQGKLKDIFDLNLEKTENRAILIAIINALLRDQNLIDKTIHCRDSDPEECGRQIAPYLKSMHNPKQIGIAGYQPALISALVDYFGPDAINVTDLCADNLDRIFKGVKIQDGITKTNDLIASSSLLLVTGSVFANNTAELFYDAFLNGKPIYFFGTTVSGIAHILELPHICPLGT
jgi:hypothetical protein